MAVKQGSLLSTLKDTPAKARKIWISCARAGKTRRHHRRTAVQVVPQGQKWQYHSPPSDPYTGPSMTGSQDAAAGGLPIPGAAGAGPLANTGLSRLPTTRSASEKDSPQLGAPHSLGDMGGGDRQQESSQLLREARAALAKGDAQRATLLVGQARHLGLTYPLNADSPDKVDALIGKAATFSQGPASRHRRGHVHTRIRAVPAGSGDWFGRIWRL